VVGAAGFDPATSRVVLPARFAESACAGL